MNYITVAYYMKGEPKQYRSFGTIQAAQAFMAGLSENTECESYGIERKK